MDTEYMVVSAFCAIPNNPRGYLLYWTKHNSGGNLQYAKVNSWHIFSTIKTAQSKALEINPTASMYPGRTL